MIRRIVVVCVTAFFWLAVCFGQEDSVFLSLTKKAEAIKNLPTNVSVITSKQIDDMQKKDLGAVLTSELGVVPTIMGTLGASNNLSIRGSTAEEVLVLIDGRRINDIGLGLVDLSSIPIDNIERIEIIRGSASAIYGTSAFGGVVNIITKTPKEETPVTNLSLSYGDFSTQLDKLDFGWKKDGKTVFVAGSRSLTDGWKKNSDYDKIDVSGKFGLETKKTGNFDVTGSFTNSKLGVPGSETFITPNARQTENKKYVKIENNFAYENNNVRSNIYFSNDVRKYTNIDTPENNQYDSNISGGELQFDTAYGVTLGGEVYTESYVDDDLQANTNIIDKARTDSAGYLQDKIVIDSLTLIPSLRFDNNSSFGSVLCPRISIVYKLNEEFKLSANSGKTWRAPTFNELYYKDSWGSSGNPNLSPEEGISSDVGAEYAVKDFSTSLTLFQADSRNLIQWVTNPVTWASIPENVGTAKQAGVEFELKQKITSGLIHKINYNYLSAEDTANNRLLNYRPYNRVNYGISCLFKSNTKLNLDVQYVGAQNVWNSFSFTNTELPEYGVANFMITQILGPDTKFWVKADNVTDKTYQTRLGYPIQGRMLSAGIDIKFID